MPKYRVTVPTTVYVYHDIEANSEDHASELAEEIEFDLDTFAGNGAGSGDARLTGVTEGYLYPCEPNYEKMEIEEIK